MGLVNIIKQIYIKSCGYSYTHMGRLFLRLFVGVMLAQFGIRQWMYFDDTLAGFESMIGLEPTAGLVLLIIVEILCSFFIMIGFCTRIMVLPPLAAMIISESYLLSNAEVASYLITWGQPAYLPMMFMGIYFFILLVGPGKISVDYFLSLYFLHSGNQSESELEEV